MDYRAKQRSGERHAPNRDTKLRRRDGRRQDCINSSKPL